MAKKKRQSRSPPTIDSNKPTTQPESKPARPNPKRASSSSTSTVKEAEEGYPLSEKWIKRFYEPVFLLHALDPIRGVHNRHPPISSSATLPKFLNALAYACDTERRGGNTVSAAALEDCTGHGEGVTLWLASNASITTETKDMIEAILKILQRVWEASLDEKTKIREVILSKMVEHSKPRLLSYYKELESLINGFFSRKKSTSESGTAGKLQQELQSLRSAMSPVNLPALVQKCHTLGRSAHLKMQQSTSNQLSPLDRIRHVVGRLGKHINATTHLLQAAQDRDLCRIFTDKITVRCLSPQKPRSSPLDSRHPTADEILGRMSSDQKLVSSYRAKIQRFETCANTSVASNLQSKYSGSVKIRVHAEAAIANLFITDRQKRFYGGEPYIGISKPSCYLCACFFDALRALPEPYGKEFRIQGEHGKLYCAWECPQLGGVAHVQRVIGEMTKRVRNDVCKHLEERSTKLCVHPDSTTGISTVFAGETGLVSATSGARGGCVDGVKVEKEKIDLNGSSDDSNSPVELDDTDDSCSDGGVDLDLFQLSE